MALLTGRRTDVGSGLLVKTLMTIADEVPGVQNNLFTRMSPAFS
jgi:hypothetical protein